jgi:hypothetical protein
MLWYWIFDRMDRCAARCDSGKGEAAMAYQPNMSERIAMYVANTAMRQLGWCRNPELMLSAFAYAGGYFNKAKFEAIYPVWGDRTQQYVMAVTVKSDGKTSQWCGGRVRAYHCSGHLFGEARFTVEWDGFRPSVQLGEFTEAA